MTDPLPLPPSRRDPLADPVVQLESARGLLDKMDARFRAVRDVALVLEEANEKALRLHARTTSLPSSAPARCVECKNVWPCMTRRLLTGADEAGDAA